MATDDTEMTQAEKIAARIHEVRKLTGLNQTEFARTIGVSRSFLSEVEALKSKPSVEMIVGVANHFPNLASAWWLLLGYGTPGPYDRDGAPGTIDWRAMLHAMRLQQALVVPVSADAEPEEIAAKVLAVLVNAYAQTFASAIGRGEAEHDARQEAEFRAGELARALGEDMDSLVVQGPQMPL